MHTFKASGHIKKAIHSHVKHKAWIKWLWDFKDWYVGITANPKQRKQQHGHPEKWKIWKATLVNTAREIEKHFLAKGMKGDVGGGKDAIFVYIY